jgi:hypothetical protein
MLQKACMAVTPNTSCVKELRNYDSDVCNMCCVVVYSGLHGHDGACCSQKQVSNMWIINATMRSYV